MKFLVITDYLNFVGGGFEPLGTLYIMSAARAGGHEVRLVENEIEKASRMIDEWQPHFVGYCAYTGYHKPLIELNRRLKQRYDFTSIFGGPHPTFFPEMIEEEGVDIVCRGEGEDALVELLDKAEKDEDYSAVKNMWVKRNGSIFRNEVRCFQPDLDKFAFPARDIFYQYPQARNNRMRVVITARGCPYSCTYCYNYKIKELYKNFPVNHLRHRKVDYIIDEILQIRDHYTIEFIYFGTDCFTAKKDWVLEFTEKYRKMVGIPFICSTRPETANPEVCHALKKANCVSIYMGIESGNEELRRDILKRKMTDEKIIAAARYIHEADLKLATFNMMLLPGETVEQALDTMRINQKCRTDYTWVAVFQPYPRTKLADYAMEKGYFDGDFDKLPKSWYRNSALKNPKKKQLERLHKMVSIGVEFPWLTPLIKLGMHLPLTPLYHLIMKIHKAYAYRFRILPLKLNFKEVTSLAWKYLFDRTE